MYWVVTASWEVEGQSGRGTKRAAHARGAGTVGRVEATLGEGEGVCRQQVELEAQITFG